MLLLLGGRGTDEAERVVEVAGCADGAMVEGPGVGEYGVADAVATCGRLLASVRITEKQREEGL